MFFAHRVRRFVEDEELVLEAGVGLETHVVGATQHAPQQAAGTQLVGGGRELAHEKQPAFFEGQLAAVLGDDAHQRVGISRVPARVADVVIELVLGIPTEHHVAEAEALVEGGEEFLPGYVLAAQDPVDVEYADLDVAELALLDDAAGVLRGANVTCLHVDPPPMTWVGIVSHPPPTQTPML